MSACWIRRPVRLATVGSRGRLPYPAWSCRVRHTSHREDSGVASVAGARRPHARSTGYTWPTSAPKPGYDRGRSGPWCGPALYIRDGGKVLLLWLALRWARPSVDDDPKATMPRHQHASPRIRGARSRTRTRPHEALAALHLEGRGCRHGCVWCVYMLQGVYTRPETASDGASGPVVVVCIYPSDCVHRSLQRVRCIYTHDTQGGPSAHARSKGRATLVPTNSRDRVGRGL